MHIGHSYFEVRSNAIDDIASTSIERAVLLVLLNRLFYTEHQSGKVVGNRRQEKKKQKVENGTQTQTDGTRTNF